MAGEVFRACLDREVDTTFMRGEEQWGCPGIIHYDTGAARMRHLSDCRNVLHLEALRARRLDKNHAGIRAHEAADRGTDERIVVSCLDPEPRQHRVAEIAR